MLNVTKNINKTKIKKLKVNLKKKIKINKKI